jgi:hypothetical protein
MRKLIIIIVLVTIISQFNIIAENTSQYYQYKNLYIFNKGGTSPSMVSNPSGNITTNPPFHTTDEQQSLFPNTKPPHDHFYWYSDPLHLGLTINDDVTITIWAKCNVSRRVSFMLSIQRYKPEGSGAGYGSGTGSQIVADEPVIFESVISYDTLDDELKNFNKGDRIGIGIMAFYDSPQPPSEVIVLYNSTNHPSHMKIRTNSISFDYINPKLSGNVALLDVNITDAFGINDITDYYVNVTNSANSIIGQVNVQENKIYQMGILTLKLQWEHSGEITNNYAINITIIDCNDNKWESQDSLRFEIEENPYPNDQNNDENGNDPENSKNGESDSFSSYIVELIIPFLLIIIIIIVLFGLLVKRKRNYKKGL